MHPRPKQTLPLNSAIFVSPGTGTGMEASILQTSRHGLVSSALFLILGVLYDCCHSRTIKCYGGLTRTLFNIRRKFG